MSLAVPQAPDLYAVALDSMSEPGGHRHWYARYEDGPRRSLAEALRRWCGTADATDQELLARAPGAVLDLGCGPGRLVVELARQRRQSAGVDTSRVAVRLARKAGATALCRSIFDPVPGEGGWDSVLLADGNIGIGGDPVALLARCRDLIGTTGRVLVELDPPGTGMRSDRVRLERGSQRGSWFDWAHVGADAIHGPATDAGLRVEETWERVGRSFAALVPDDAPALPRPGVLTVRILVTGGAGFIGSHVAEAARDAGYEVRVLDALLPAVHPTGGQPRLPDGVELMVGDVRDPATVDRALLGVDAVSHQAAMVGLGVDVQDMPDYAGINGLGTAVLLAAMARADVGRLVLAGSMVVYGEGRYECERDGVVPAAPRRRADLDAGRFEPPCPVCGRQLSWGAVTEETAPDPRNTYAATKLGQEHLASAWASSTGGGALTLRYHNVYGPSMPRDTPYAGVAAIFRSALEAGRAPRVFEDGGQQRDFVHVTDVAEANLLALLADPPESALRAYNVASGRPHTVGDMARALADAFGGPEPVVTGEYRIGDVRHVVASPVRAEEELGFRTRVEFADGMRAFATDPLRGAL